MASLAGLRVRAKGLIMGRPRSGKTGAFAALANAGYKLRIIDFDGNLQSLVTYVRPEFKANVDVVTLEDKFVMDAGMPMADGVPEAFAKGFKLLDRWAYTAKDGTKVDLGSSREWGPDTVVILDSVTGQAAAALNRFRKLNKTTDMRKLSGGAQDAQLAFVENATSGKFEWHFFAISHLKLIGPRDIEIPKDADPEEEALKLAQMEGQAKIPYREYPSAAGQQLPKVYASHFDMVLLAEIRMSSGTGQPRRVLTWTPREDIDLSLAVDSSLGLKDPLPLETGLATIMEHLTGSATAPK